MAKKTRDPLENRSNYEEENNNPAWFKPIMFGLMLFGLVWILTYYISSAVWPIPAIGAWNIAVGFGIMFIGFLMTTRWK
jgi:predicted Abi (CAAX) family protease